MPRRTKAAPPGLTVRQLGTIVTSEKLRDRIRLCYRMMNACVHELMDFKKENGICRAGISCMKKTMPGSTYTCAACKDAKDRGYKPRFDENYLSLYALGQIEEAEKSGTKLYGHTAHLAHDLRITKTAARRAKNAAPASRRRTIA